MDLSLLERMVETDPHNPSFSSEIANFLDHKVTPTKKLIEALKKQIELGITSVPSLLLIGKGYFSIGNLKEAQKHWELAIAKEPENAIGLNNLATCLIAISASNADRAIDMVSKANSISPNNADILDTWGEALLAEALELGSSFDVVESNRQRQFQGCSIVATNLARERR